MEFKRFETKKFTMDCFRDHQDDLGFIGIDCSIYGEHPAFTKEVADSIVEFWEENLTSHGHLLWYEHDENGGRYVEEWEGERDYYPAEVVNGEIRYCLGSSKYSSWMWHAFDEEE